jgi:hypothetical protein
MNEYNKIEPVRVNVVELPRLSVIEPPRVSVTVGFTANMGNFESARIDIGVEASANENEKASDAVTRVFKLVEAKLAEKFTELREELASAGLGEE